MSTATATAPALSKITADAEDQFDAIAKRLARGEQVPPDEIQGDLILLGRSLPDLTCRVEQAKQRLAAADKLTEARRIDEQNKARETKLRDATEHYRQVRAENDSIIRECQQKIGAAREPVENLQDEIQEANRKRQKIQSEGREALLATADPALQKQINGKWQQLAKLRGQLGGIQRGANATTQNANQVKAMRKQFEAWKTTGHAGVSVDFDGNALIPIWLGGNPAIGERGKMPQATTENVARANAYIEERESKAEAAVAGIPKQIESIEKQLQAIQAEIKQLQQQQLDPERL